MGRSKMRKEQNTNLLSLMKSLKEFSEERSEITNELMSITKSVITRLSALEITIQHIEKTMMTDTERASFINLIDNLQEQVDVLAHDIYETD
tara:strand:- start:68 stop:343 length:276 start_codon:yes stop_codon:yes gene_type:complete